LCIATQERRSSANSNKNKNLGRFVNRRIYVSINKTKQRFKNTILNLMK
jgi:hypothetical protein